MTLCVCEKCRNICHANPAVPCPKCTGKMREATAIEREWHRRLETERKAGWR